MNCGTCNRSSGLYRNLIRPIIKCPSCCISVCYFCSIRPETVYHMDNCEEESF